MEIFAQFIDIVLHLDKHMDLLIQQYGVWIYAILFLIVFGETGFVILPFLPGDSLLFVAGGLAALGNMDIMLLMATLTVAAILGNTLNYTIGRFFGQKITAWGKVPFLTAANIAKAHAFYELHGGKAVVASRFMPLFRSFVPFVAGMAGMGYRSFTFFNVVGALIWVVGLCLCGYLFANVPVVKENLTLMVLGIIFVSLLPALIGWLKSRSKPAA